MLRLFSILGYLVMVAGLLGLIVSRNLFSASPFVLAPQAAAVALMIWARITFGRRSFHLAANPTSGGLVTRGPYRFIRHPIYAAVCLFTLCAVLAHGSPLACGLGLSILAGALGRIFCEETLLREQYPAYKDYAARTWRLIPFIF